MRKLIAKVSFLFVLLIFFSIQVSVSFESKIQDLNQEVMNNQEISKSLKVSPDYGKIPLYFIPNEGQVDGKALFYAKASRYTLWLTKEGLVFDSMRKIEEKNRKHQTKNLRDRSDIEDSKYDRDVSRLTFINSNKNPEVVPVDQTEHRVNYFIGNDKSKWRTNIQTSNAVSYKELYKNIDLKVYGIEKQIEYDFIVKPGGEVSDINFDYRDVKKTKIDKEGNLIIETKFGELEHAKPVCYQVIGEKRVEIEAEFKKIKKNTYGFKVKKYNKNYELIIDPVVLIYSTYLGDSDEDTADGIAIDENGNAYVVGHTFSTDFPVTPGAFDTSYNGSRDTFVTKINSTGTDLIYSTYLGGSGSDYGLKIAVDGSENAYVTGWVGSTDFPVTPGAFDTSFNGYRDTFVTKLNSTGTDLIYSTYLGGSNYDWVQAIAVDGSENAHLAGWTRSTDFPVTPGAFDTSYNGENDAFITKINSMGTDLLYSTYLGGSTNDDEIYGITVDESYNAYVTGRTWSIDFPTTPGAFDTNLDINDFDAFITRFNSGGTNLIYSTFLGGNSDDTGYELAVDGSGNAYVTGHTYSTDFPTTPGAYDSNWDGWYDGFITKINSTGTNLSYSTYFGGGGYEKGSGIKIDRVGNAYITGWTSSTDFPTTPDAFDTSFNGDYDVIITKINSTGTNLIYSTYLGGSGNDRAYEIAFDGCAYITGGTPSSDFPTTPSAFDTVYNGGTDVFITKFCFYYFLTITAGEGGTTDPEPGTYDHCSGTQVTIEAIPDEGYRFSHWSGDASGTKNPIKITMDSDKWIKANFIRQYTMNISSGPGGTTNPPPGSYNYDEGTEATITAIPYTHYKFSEWTGNVPSEKRNDNPISITMNSDLSIKANFIRIIYPPLNFTGEKVLNRSLSQAEYINVLTWEANPNNASLNIMKYRIYEIVGASRDLLVELDTNTFEYWHRDVDKDKQYTYGICAVNDEEGESDPAYITVQ